MCVCVLTLTFCDPIGCSPPGSSVHGILQVRILKWIAISSSRGSSWPRDWALIFCISCIAGGFFTTGATWEAPLLGRGVVNSVFTLDPSSVFLGPEICWVSLSFDFCWVQSGENECWEITNRKRKSPAEEWEITSREWEAGGEEGRRCCSFTPSLPALIWQNYFLSPWLRHL